MARPNIVLVHGAWADGSSWSAVIERLQADGYRVTAPQFPLSSLDADVARLRQVLRLQDGPTVVAGHSYGGQIMTALGSDAPNVSALVYIAAFALDQDEVRDGPPSKWGASETSGAPDSLVVPKWCHERSFGASSASNTAPESSCGVGRFSGAADTRTLSIRST